jgi:hypothetical protein
MGCIGLFSHQLKRKEKKRLLLFRQHNSIDKDIWLEIVDVISSRVRSGFLFLGLLRISSDEMTLEEVAKFRSDY